MLRNVNYWKPPNAQVSAATTARSKRQPQNSTDLAPEAVGSMRVLGTQLVI
jgi:hypothetical protein